jgi:hypothetical protein
VSENPYEAPNACDIIASSRTSRLPLHPFGLMIGAVAAFFIHALSTKVPAGELQLLRSPSLAATLALVSISVLVLSVIFTQQCRWRNSRAAWLYLLLPVAMHAYFAWRILAG